MSFEITRDMALDLIIMTLKSQAPKDTGNLADNGIVMIDDTIKIGGEIAPYAFITEEINISSKGWIKNTMELLQPTLKSFFENNLSNDDIRKMTQAQELSFDNQFDAMANLREKKESV